MLPHPSLAIYIKSLFVMDLFLAFRLLAMRCGCALVGMFLALFGLCFGA